MQSRPRQRSFWRPDPLSSDLSSDRHAESITPGIMNVHKENLPIYQHQDQILAAVQQCKVIILSGETGSGKSTQLPQMLYRTGGWCAQGQKIGITQPRRLAAVSVATRVAQEMHVALGNEVGYVVRFEERFDAQKTKIKFCTDGMLLRETMIDPLLSEYSVLILDEAHERSLHTDLLLGLVKKIQRKRPELRVIISSATLQVQEFIDFFSKSSSSTDVGAIQIHQRQHPVDIFYLENPAANYLHETVATVVSIIQQQDVAEQKNKRRKKALGNDILCFLPGQEEIQFVIRELKEKLPASIDLFPLYAALPMKMQQQALVPSSTRKVIVATTIAETSITIPGIGHVVDCCLVKLPFYNPLNQLESLIVTKESKDAATQRAGRSGREGPGKCYRLMTEKDFHQLLPDSTLPEIQRTNLAWIVLQLRALGIQDIIHFDFLSCPAAESMIRAFELLFSLGALDQQGQLIEPLGTHMAEFPVNPRMSKMILSSFKYRCTEEILSIAAVLSVNDIFVSPRGSRERKAKILTALGEFAVREGDHLTMLNVFDAFRQQQASSQQSWCQENFLNFRALKRAMEIRRQLQRYIHRFRGVQKATIHDRVEDDLSTDAHQENIRKCITAGYFSNIALLHSSGKYRTIRDQLQVEIHPTSVFSSFGNLPTYLVFHEMLYTDQIYIRDCSAIHPKWLTDIAADYYTVQRTQVAGSSGTMGLPTTDKFTSKSVAASNDAKKKGVIVTNDVLSQHRILFKKSRGKAPTKSSSKVPVYMGKRKGGLRSQF